MPECSRQQDFSERDAVNRIAVDAIEAAFLFAVKCNSKVVHLIEFDGDRPAAIRYY